MSRTWILWLAFAALSAAQPVPAKKDSKAPATRPDREEQAPPEEDESLVPKEYSFNPLQASKEMRIGNYYFKRGKFRAALDTPSRFCPNASYDACNWLLNAQRPAEFGHWARDAAFALPRGNIASHT
jgi:hypothetical protein